MLNSLAQTIIKASGLGKQGTTGGGGRTILAGGGFGGRQGGVDRHQVPARLCNREVGLDHRRAVRQHRGDGRALRQAQPAETVHQTIRLREELAGAYLASVGIDEG